jgi:hypothetical protein
MKDTFLQRMNSRLTERGIKGRQDLELHDVKLLEEGRAARVLATYSSLYGPPSVWDVQNWLASRMGEFSLRVQARTETIAAYPERNFVTFVVEQKVLRQPLSATAQMVKAGVDQFLDRDNMLWEVVNAEQGPGYIVRKEGVTVEKMLELRRQALRGGVSGRKHVTLASVDSIPSAGGGFATADVGDVVDFYHGGMIFRGKITSSGSAGVKVKKLNSSDTFTVDPGQITTIVEKGAGAQKEQDDAMRRYFSLQYPGNPEMTEIISPTSSLPVKDDRPPPGGDPIQPLSVDAAVTGSARPFVKAGLGKPSPNVRVQSRGVSGKARAKH